MEEVEILVAVVVVVVVGEAVEEDGVLLVILKQIMLTVEFQREVALGYCSTNGVRVDVY